MAARSVPPTCNRAEECCSTGQPAWYRTSPVRPSHLSSDAAGGAPVRLSTHALRGHTSPEGVVQAGQRLNPSLRRYLREWRRRDPAEAALQAGRVATPELPTPQALYDRLPLRVQAAIVAGFLAGESKTELAKTFSVSRSGIATLLRRHGVIEP